MVVFQLLLAEVLEIAAREQIAGIGEGRYPFAVLQARIPPHMIKMQVGAQHEVDPLGAQTQRGEILEVGRLRPVNIGNRAVLVVAVAGIDQDVAPTGLQHIAVHAHHERGLLRCRTEGVVAVPLCKPGEVRRRNLGHDQRQRRTTLHLEQFGNGHPPQAYRLHVCLPIRLLPRAPARAPSVL